MLSTSSLTWSKAEEQCRTHGGHLVVLNTVEELVRFHFPPVWLHIVSVHNNNGLIWCCFQILFAGLPFRNCWNQIRLLDWTCRTRTWGTLELGRRNWLQFNPNVRKMRSKHVPWLSPLLHLPLFSFWDIGQPDDWDYIENGEDCGQFHASERRKRKLWNDADCNLSHFYICETKVWETVNPKQHDSPDMLKETGQRLRLRWVVSGFICEALDNKTLTVNRAQLVLLTLLCFYHYSTDFSALRLYYRNK